MVFKMKEFKFYSDEKFIVDKSNIDGKGIIAAQDIKKGEFVGAAVVDEKALRPGGTIHDTRTILGRTLNHQDTENTVHKSENNTLNIYAKNKIAKGTEITTNYKKLPDYVDKNTEGYK